MSDEVVYSSGAKRSSRMPYYSAIPRRSLRLLALRATGAPKGTIKLDPETGIEMEGGSDKYGYGNWRRGLEFEDTFNHTLEHLLNARDAIQSGDETKALAELAGAAWGIMFPMMEFAKEYAEQFHVRNDFMFGEGDGPPIQTAEETDVYMSQWCKDNNRPLLIKPLSPVV